MMTPAIRTGERVPENSEKIDTLPLRDMVPLAAAKPNLIEA